MRRVLPVLVLIGFAGLVVPVSAKVLELSDENVNFPIGTYVEYYRDATQSLTFTQVRALGSGPSGFIASERDALVFGSTPDHVWVRFTMKNVEAAARTFYLEYSYPAMDEVILYTQRMDGRFEPPRVYGDLQPFRMRDLKHRNLVFPIELAPGQTSQIYLRFRTQTVVDIPLSIWSPEGFHQKDHDEQYVLGLYYGIMVVMLLYNLFIYFSARDSNYLYYAGYIVCISLLEMAYNGLAYEYLWPNWVWWNNRVIVFAIAFGMMAIVQFSRSLLDLRRDEYPWLNRWADVTLALMAMIAIATTVVPIGYISRVGILIALNAAALVVVIGLVRLRAGYHPARFFMVAWSFFLVGTILHLLKNLGVLPSVFITNYGIQVGSALEVLLLSFALADKINVLRKEKEQAQTRYIESQKVAMDNQLRLMNAFYRFVPGEFIKNLNVESIADIQVGHAVLRSMTILFTDIRNFTGLSARMSAQENFDFLNSFLKRMEPHIQENKGFVDKFIGDAIMALFSQGAEFALRAAVEMRNELKGYNDSRVARGYAPVSIGIGLNTGEVMLGTVGSANRIDTTVIGNTVNLAAGLESLTKAFHVDVLVSGYTVAALTDPTQFNLREIDRVRVKGKSDPVVIYEFFDMDPEHIRERKLKSIPDLTAALVFYKMRQFEKCLDALRRCSEFYAEDPIVRIYRERCDRFMRSPPGDNWDGVTSIRA